LTFNCLLSTVHGFFAIIFVAAIIATPIWAPSPTRAPGAPWWTAR
jgi:hypothetical protein